MPTDVESQPLPAVVFIHGGCHNSQAWNETLSALRARRPDLNAFAIDLPGRGAIEGDLASLTVDGCAQSVITQIDERLGHETPLVLVGHSMAGVVIPRVVGRIGGGRVRRFISVACCMPPAGQSIVDSLPRAVRLLASPVLGKPIIERVPFLVSRFIFGNRASRAQRARIRHSACREGSALITTRVSDYQSLRDIPVGWVLPTRDRAVPPRKQRAAMAALGGFDRMTTIDAGHEVLITHPDEVAEHILAMVLR
ncbi:alpha/beta fold hydrolase [Mycobacterium colombiense]|uniref:Alpha/beta hydrolase protein n=1 Tax=Mycobacterium colombiense CECT 3035 TaxID=1041522 RepID=J5EC97_9MYCO|nr:alpha/beta hydrolase protein [Mycobacterium colombiense CECT 3035]